MNKMMDGEKTRWIDDTSLSLWLQECGHNISFFFMLRTRKSLRSITEVARAEKYFSLHIKGKLTRNLN